MGKLTKKSRVLRILQIPLLAALLVAASVQAQPGPGMGGGMGGGSGANWRANQANTPGFMLMSEQERLEHQNRMRSLQTYDECTAYVGEHRAQMALRAQEKGVTLQSPGSPCETMKSRGRIK